MGINSVGSNPVNQTGVTGVTNSENSITNISQCQPDNAGCQSSAMSQEPEVRDHSLKKRRVKSGQPLVKPKPHNESSPANTSDKSVTGSPKQAAAGTTEETTSSTAITTEGVTKPPSTTTQEIDLSDQNVLFAKTKEAISFVLDQKNTGKISNFFTDSQNPIDAIANNLALKTKLQEIEAKLGEIGSQSELTDEAYLEKLENLHSLLKEAHKMIAEDKNIANHSVFPQFIRGVMESINVSIADVLAKKVLQEFTPIIEERLKNRDVSSSISAGVSVTDGIAHGGGGGEYSKREHTTGQTLFETSMQVGFNFEAGVGGRAPGKLGDIFTSASLDLTGRLRFVTASMYASVEQLLDAKKFPETGFVDHIKKSAIKILSSNSENLKAMASKALSIDSKMGDAQEQAAAARRELQNTERQLLRSMGDIESFLRMTGAVSHNVYIKRPHITRTEAPMMKIGVTGKATLSGELSDTFNKLGLEVSAGLTRLTYKVPRHHLALLDNNCSPNAKLSAEDVKTTIGQKYDLSQKYLPSSTNESVKISNSIDMLSSDLHCYSSVLQSLASLQEKHSQDKKDISKLKNDIEKLEKQIKENPIKVALLDTSDEATSPDLKGQLEDLKTQLQAIKAEYAQDEGTLKELKEAKHAYEKRLSPKVIKPTSEGRLGVFKAGIVTAVQLSQHAKAGESDASLRRMFHELETLESLLEFSKDESSRTGTVMQKANSSFVDGEISGTVKIGDCSISCQRNDRSGSPFSGENGKFFSFAVSVPSTTFNNVDKAQNGFERITTWINSGEVSLMPPKPREADSGIRAGLLDDDKRNNDGSESVAMISAVKGSLKKTISALTGTALALKETASDAMTDIESLQKSASDIVDGASEEPKLPPTLEETLKSIGESIGEKGRKIRGAVSSVVGDTAGLVASSIPETAEIAVGMAASAVAGTAIGKASSSSSKTSDTEIKTQTIRIEPNAREQKHLKPLPGRPKLITRDTPAWIVQHSEITTTIESKTDLTIPGGAVSAQVGMSGKTQIGQKTQQLGTDTMSYITSMFDKASRGNTETTQIWKSFRDNHKEELSEMLKNLAKDNSNILYELQGLYNANLKNIGADRKLGAECTELFEELLSNCQKFSEERIDLQTALTSLEKVLNFNYEHNSLVHFNQALATKHK
ncbi:MAG: tektin family protein [Puniceicoccales bacterium]|jgi:uncharacterized protein YeeX (DUF496 family)|nr:tektin family protein [Puniceicoccales bacterium]